jgi:hypothetical protein
MPPQALPEPRPEEGYTFRWIRTSLLGAVDPTNASAKFREGWEPCKADDHPEMLLTADPNTRFKGNIEIGGLLLCKAPVELMDQRRAYYAKMSDSQIQAVDNNFMRTNDARMPLFAEKKSSVTFGRGNK